MKISRTNWRDRMIGMGLALMLACSVFFAAPEHVWAAEVTIPGSGSSSVTITDDQCYYATRNYTWLKFKPKADGYVTFRVSNASKTEAYTDGRWGLFNASKKQISSFDNFDSRQTASYYKTNVYGVKKNKTYYFCVGSLAGAKVSASFQKVKETSGTSRSKAKSVSKGKLVKGTITAGSKTADWYKFKLKKRQTLKISYSAKTNYVLKLSLYAGKQRICSVLPNYKSAKTSSIYVTTKTGKKIKLSPGTYYVKVERYNAKSSGYYTWKWN